MALERLRSKRFVITIEEQHERRKILQIIFAASDGSLFVSFPYFKRSKGLASRITFPANAKLPTNLSLIPGGKVTSHLVKYSHHPSGRAQFSQTGRVQSTIGKEAIPLLKAQGHIFTVQIQGLSGFEHTSPGKDDKPPHLNRTVLNYKFEKPGTASFKLVGRWYSAEVLSKRIVGEVRGPKVIGKTPDGKTVAAFLISPPTSYTTSEHILMVSCERRPILDPDEETVLTFMGGFDSPEIVENESLDTTFLALSYPVSDYDALGRRIGSIDLNRTNLP